MSDWKDRLGVVFSTSNDYEYATESDTDNNTATINADKQQLKIFLDKRQRKGKQVTIISGFRGHEDDLKELGKMLKTKCGVGGSVKDGEIIIQGDFREKVVDILKSNGYTKSRVI